MCFSLQIIIFCIVFVSFLCRRFCFVFVPSFLFRFCAQKRNKNSLSDSFAHCLLFSCCVLACFLGIVFWGPKHNKKTASHQNTIPRKLLRTSNEARYLVCGPHILSNEIPLQEKPLFLARKPIRESGIQTHLKAALPH